MFRTIPSASHCLLLLTSTVSAAASPGFWENIYEYKAPPPDQGPPGAAAALRDRKYLPWEICGIVGAYLVTVGFALTLLLTVGRRLRRSAEMSPISLEIEMVKAGPQAFEPTPVSPASTTRSWIQKTFKKTPSIRSGFSSPTSPTHRSTASFDHVVLQSDKEDRQKEMERLYAAVMEHQAEQEARKSQSQSVVSEIESPVKGPQEPRRPLQINTAAAPGDLLPSPHSATSYKSYRPFHPPENPPMSTQSPYGSVASPRKEPPAMSPHKLPLSPRSILSRASRPPSQGSTSSSKTRKALRNLRISAPIQRFPNDDDDEARTPLSPRFHPSAAAHAPPSATTTATPARTPGTAGTVDSAYAHEARDRFEPLPIPRPNPQRSYANSSPANTHAPGGPLSPPPMLTFSPAKSTTSSTSSLPLRSYQDTSAMPPPPTPTKTTYLERRREQLSLTTPRTGVPYSPYMPFTPITPITPHLVTKRERKEKKKMEGKKVLTEEDMVRSDDETWY